MSPSLVVLPRPRTPGRADGLRRIAVPHRGAASAIAAGLLPALADPAADVVLLVDAGVALEPEAVQAAVDRLRADDAHDVVAWRAPGAAGACAAALLPLDAVRAIGLAHASLGSAALADLVLRAHDAGFRTIDAPDGGMVTGPAEPTVRDRVLLAMLHEPAAERGRVVRGSLGAELRSLLGRRWGEVAVRHRDLAAVLVAVDAEERTALVAGGAARIPGGVLRQAVSLHAALWLGWAPLRRRARAAAFEQAAPEGWVRRFAGHAAEVDDTLPDGERGAAHALTQTVRWRPWATTRRGTSAA